MRRADRRALMFIMVAALGVWGGMLLERRLAGREGVASISEIKGLSTESLNPSLSSSPTPVPSPEGRGNDGSYADGQSPLPFRRGDGGEGVRPSSFDPNTADSATLVAVGLKPWQARNIIRYRARGGRYRRVEDLKRLYGMTPELYERLAPYVRIDKRFRPYSDEELEADQRRWEAERAEREARHDSLARRYPHQEKFEELVELDLNSVDTTTLKRVPGIASYRARQIIRYRERLGGYVSTAQLAEIEGFPANELEAWFKVEPGPVRRIDLNRASVQEMGRHPYIGFERARAIESYRRNQGRLNSLDDLSLLPAFTPEAMERMRPYVDFGKKE